MEAQFCSNYAPIISKGQLSYVYVCTYWGRKLLWAHIHFIGIEKSIGLEGIIRWFFFSTGHLKNLYEACGIHLYVHL